MRKMTVTEALAELRVLQKRLEKERQHVGQFCCRSNMQSDPFTKEGGSEAMLKTSLQKIDDLELNLVRVRKAIQDVNSATPMKIDSDYVPAYVDTIQKWLMWKREVLPHRLSWLQRILGFIDQARRETKTKNPSPVKLGEQEFQIDLLVCVDEAALRDEHKELEAASEMVDGMLNLKNATTFVEIDD